MNHDNQGGLEPENDGSLHIDRREYLKTTGALASTGIATSQIAAADETQSEDGTGRTKEPLSAPTNLRAEFEQSPNNLDPDSRPRLTWEISSTSRNRAQSAYWILVASSESNLTDGVGDIWDSGKTASTTSTNVPLGGGELDPDTTYHWAVRVWDEEDQTTPWSEPAQFTTALPVGTEPWGGDWIGRQPGAEYPEERRNPSPLLRREVTFDKPIETARVHVSGLGFYDLQINGERVGERVLDPGRTDYEKTVLYSTYDVTEILGEGDNAIGVELGRGRLGELVEDTWGWTDVSWWSDPQLLMQLNVEFTDGTSTSVVTDEHWSVTDGPRQFDSLFSGEVYDARAEQPGWASPEFDDSDWNDVSIVEPLGGEYMPQRVQPIQVVDTHDPVEMTEPEDGVYVFDIGDQIAGWVELTVDGPAGTEITIKHGEGLHDGKVDNEYHDLEGPLQTDEYVLDGDGTETWEPKFSYKGFRYVQLDGFPGEASLDSIEVKEIHTAVESGVDSDFDSSNDLLNKIHQESRQAMLNNLHSVHTDTPTFEKNGWTEHSLEMGPSLNYNFDMPRFWQKMVRDCTDAQEDDGNIPYIVPSPVYGHDSNDPGWDAAYVFVPWYSYQHYGDERILKEHYEGMKDYVEYVRENAENHIVRGGIGDWATPDGRTPPEGGHIVSTVCYYHSVRVLSETAELLANDGDADEYSDLAANIETAFNDEFFDSETNVYSTGQVDEYRQTSNAYPLGFDLVPDDHEEAVAANLAENVMTVHDGHLDVGAHGLQYLLPVLTEYGYVDVAMTIATQRTYPSWGWWFENGEVSLLEFWYLDARSRTHDFLGSIDQWFYQYLAGIRSPDQPGFKELTIKPHIPEDLSEASATTETIRGAVSSAWTKNGVVLDLEITIPWNATAEFHVPARHKQGVTEGGTPATDVPSLSFADEDDEFAVFEGGSGEYNFTSDPVRGSVGFARDTARDLLERLDELQSDGTLTNSQTKHLRAKLEKFRDQAAVAVTARDAGDTRKVTRSVHKLLVTVNQLDKWVTKQGKQKKLSTDAVTQLTDVVSTLDTEISYASGILLDSGTALTVDEAVIAGGTTRVTAAVHNGGDEKMNDLGLSVQAPEGWSVTPVSKTHAGNLKPGETFAAEFDVGIPLSEAANGTEHELSSIATYRYVGGTAERPASTTVTVQTPVRFTGLTGDAVQPGQQTTIEATIENRITDPVTGTIALDLPDGWSAPSSTSYRVGGNGEAAVTIPVTAAATAVRGRDAQIGAAVTYPGGVGDRASTEIYVPFGPLPDGFSEFASTRARMGMADGEFVVDANGDELLSGDEYGCIYADDVVSEDSTIIVRLSELENKRPFANKAGLMVRNDITASGEATGYVALGVSPFGIAFLNWDSDDDGYLDSGSGWSWISLPCWLKIERDGTTFTGYYSTDGSSWEEVGSTTVESAADVQDAGMFSTSSSADVLNRADFAEFEVR